MAVRIREVHTPGERKRFIKFPWKIYRGDRNWVPPLLQERLAFLNPKKNPFFDHSEVALFMALDGTGNEVGRIAAIINHNHIRTHNEKTGFFGLFESIDNPEVAHRLFEAAADFHRSSGMMVMRGPENMSVNDDLGLLVDGFDSPPFLMMPHNPAYYPSLVESFGFAKAMDLYAYQGITSTTNAERLKRGVEVSIRRYHITIRTVNMKDFGGELKRIQRLYNEAWEQNWGAVAMTDREFEYLAKDLKQILDPDLCLLAEVDGKTVGFSLALPDFNQVLIHINGRLFPVGIFKLLYYRRRINRVRVLTMGVLKEYRRMGVDMSFVYESYRCGLRKGYDSGEMSWILENNGPMNNALLNLNYRVHKTYRLYDYRL
ncbi:MAG TPA: N-acetyltransferase [Acidobacteriota bacterium]|nr:N-acetyltransferase [Acidobacteriota bacterium]